jgi:CheY-like chemotaxis protein
MSRVLMVDDAGLFQMLEGTFLRRLGCAIVRAADGPDLLARAEVSIFDLILLDAAHPGLDAPACVRALKSRTMLRDVPIAVVADPARLAACSEAGADVTLPTPLPAGALELALCSLGRVARRSGARRSARGTRLIRGACGRTSKTSPHGLSATSGVLPLEASIQLSLRLRGRERRGA